MIMKSFLRSRFKILRKDIVKNDTLELVYRFTYSAYLLVYRFTYSALLTVLS